MTVIQFTDGTTTIDLTGATGDYALMYDSWAPKIASRRRDQMAGRSPYEDVQEVMQIKVKGTSASDCLANLRTLIELFDQANAWYDDPDGNTAVEIQVRPNGSSTTVDAVIWNAEVIAPTDFTWLGATATYQLDNVTLTFTRCGLWLGATETETATASTGNPAIIASTTFTDTAKIPWPYDLHIWDAGFGDAINPNQAVILLCHGAGKIELYEAESQTLGTGVTAPGSITGASAADVARCASTTSTTKTISNTSALSASSSKNIVVYCMVYNNSASAVNWDIVIRVWAGTSGSYDESRSFRVEAGTDKTIIGAVFNTIRAVGTVQIRATPDTTGSSPGDDLDVDYWAVMALDDDADILRFDSFGSALFPNGLGIRHRLNSHVDPVVYITNSSDETGPESLSSGAPSLTGGTPVLTASGNQITVLVMGGAGTANNFVIEDTGNTELSFDLEITRTKAYLTPL